MPRITIDFSGAYAEQLGVTGLILRELKAVESKAKAAHNRLFERPEMTQDGFFGLPKNGELLNSSVQLARKLKGSYENVVVIGIGGSANGFKAVADALLGSNYNLKANKNRPRYFVLDYLDPSAIRDIFEIAPPNKSVYVAISKSGKTQETAAHLALFSSRLQRELGRQGLRERLVIITELERENPFQRMAEKLELRCLEVPPLVGGRYSVLSPVGIFPLALLGVNVRSLLRGAELFNRRVRTSDPQKNPALHYAMIHYLYYDKGHNITVFFLYDRSLKGLGDWLVQLWAESLGKRFDREGSRVELGLTPVSAVGPRDQHSLLQLLIEGPFDKVITMIWPGSFKPDLKLTVPSWLKKGFGYLSGKSFGQILAAEALGTYEALVKSGKATIKIIPERTDAENIGFLLQFFMCATAYLAELWGINAFDQPGVQLSKDISRRLLGGQ
ncbi:MAG TPA: hypothetical protein ENF73_01210 [Proteobacteria bacterium]|nr:hypothetical protein [Pseudomonadota bacterium]